MQLSNQALGAIMMALQESLMNQTDIMPVLQGFELITSDDGLIVKNPSSESAPTAETAVETTE